MKQIKILTLLLGFCVALASCNSWNNMSKTGQGAIIGAGGGAALGSIIGAIAGNTAIGTAIGTAVGAGTGAVIGNRMDKVKKQAEAQLQNAEVETVKDANGLDAVKVTFSSGILFATNKADLTTASKNELNKLIDIMKQNSDVSIDVQGYTDSTGNDAINNPLSVSRAQSVANYLTANGVQYSQLKKVNGYGSSNPVADNSTVAGRQKNRRVEVYLYASQEMINKAQQQAN
ncbi:MAG: OmpA family protein [Prevotella sp.]|nr:OmpA family protein [Prevotella sp.]